MFKLFIESDYIENNLIYFTHNKEDVLIFNQSMKALPDHCMLFSYKYSMLLNVRKSGYW